MASVDNVKHIALDMDGTIYLGGALFPSTIPFLDTLDELGIEFSFITNNNSRSRAAYASRLRSMGIHIAPKQVYTSAHATIHYLQETWPDVKRLFVVGTSDLKAEFTDAGFACVDDEPEAVVVGFDTAIDYDRLSRTAYWISQSLPYIATHPDRVCPTDQPIVLPDCGAFCALLESATGRQPDAIPGKPNALMLQGVQQASGLSPHEIAVVGDRLYTDVRMARDAGALAVLTLTGETTEDDLSAEPPHRRPDLVITGLDSLAEQLQRSHAQRKASKFV